MRTMSSLPTAAFIAALLVTTPGSATLARAQAEASQDATEGNQAIPVAVAAARAQAEPAQGATEGMSRRQMLVLREAFQLVTTVGNEVWPGWARTPLTVVVIEDDYEYLVNAPAAWDRAGGFQLIEQRFIGQPIYRRPRTLPLALRAAFPVAGLPAAVVGAWRPTEESPNEWAVGLVHEWFHVLQMNRGEDTKLLSLAMDNVGDGAFPSLQLDYPFAYGDEHVGHAIHLLGNSLYDFWSRWRSVPRPMQRKFLAETSWAALRNLETVVSLTYGSHAYDYFRYQTWKEGVARYTQVRVSSLAADFEDNGRFYHQPGFTALQGSMSYTRLREEVSNSSYWLMRTPAGTEGGNPTSFYGIGHGLAELLDAVNPTWKERYFDADVWLDDMVFEIMEPRAIAHR